MYLVAERGLRARYRNYRPGALTLFGLGLLTYVLVNFTWVFFRAKDFTTAWHVLKGMSGVNYGAKPILPTIFVVAVAAVIPRYSGSALVYA